MKSTKGWLLFIAVATVVWIGLCQYSQGALEDAIASTCRVVTPIGGKLAVGTGFCIANEPAVWILTNAHVIAKGTQHSTEWYWEAKKSIRIPATLVQTWNTETLDLALLKIDRAWFGERVPPAIRFAPADYVAPKASMVWTVGCPGGAAPTALRSTIVRYETQRASMELLPRVESGRSGSGVFSDDGTHLLGIVDSWDEKTGDYGCALYVSQIRALLKPPVGKPRLFDGSLMKRCQSGICGNRGQQQQQAAIPPGTGRAYPQLPPLKGIDDVPPPLPLSSEESQLLKDLDFQINDLLVDILANQDALKEIRTELTDKETRLKALFGEDYSLLKDIAANATAAKTAAEVAKSKAEDAQKAAGILTGTILELPATVDRAVEGATADLEKKVGLVDRLKTRLDASDLKTAAAASKVLDVAGKVKEVSGKLTPWSLAARFGWMPVGLGIGLLALWGRIEWKRRNEIEFRTKTGEILSRGTGAVANVADAAKDYVTDKAQKAKERLVSRLFGAIDKADEDEEDERILGRLRSVLGGAQK